MNNTICYVRIPILISTTTFNINFTLRIKFLILYLSSEVTNV